MAYYDALIAKWATLTPGTTAAKLAQINAITVAGPTAALIVPTYRIFNVLDTTEFGALSAANQQRVRDILSMGTVDASTGTNARALLLSIFGAGTATRAALVALANSIENTTIPWWQATVAQGGGGLSSIVTAGDLAAAGNLS
jgi:hypothetical protein